MLLVRIEIAIVAFIATATLTASAQSVDVGADFVSRYVWRGTDFGESFSVQPSLAVRFSGFEAGTWGSYSLAADAALSNEVDLWVGYTVETETAGSVTIAVTDYYFPFPGAADEGMDFFNFKNDGGGAHWVEPSLSYSGPAVFPITVYAGIMALNDPENSVYAEISYPFSFERDVEIRFTAGASLMESEFYGTPGFNFVNLGLSGTKVMKITDSFSIPLRVAYVLNPNARTNFLVLGVSL